MAQLGAVPRLLRAKLRPPYSPGVLGRADLNIVLRTQGLIHGDEAQELAQLAAQSDPSHAIVEVGSFRGRSTVALALGTKRGNGAPVFAVEPHERFTGPLGGEFGPPDRRAFFRNLLAAGAVERVHPIAVSSEVIAPGWKMPVGVLWIDGDHRYAGVQRDLRCWEPHVVPGGFVAFHDALSPELGPHRVIGELLMSERFERVGDAVRLMVVLRKVSSS
jgi:hypothetical protein